MTLALYLSGWLLAAILFGLWLGERGRRIDAQLREGVVPVGKPKAAIVKGEATNATHDQAIVFEEAKKKHVDECMAQGYTEAEAVEDWEQMMAQVNTTGGDTPWQADI